MVGRPSGFQLAGSAPQRYERFVAPIMAPFVDALLDAAEVGPGDAVLDVACGTGFATREAAVRVSPGGRVAGVDVNPGMLAVAAAGGFPLQVTWHEGPAEHLPFGAGEFDTVVCQQGLQFFPDLPAALGEAARVCHEDGRVAGTVWAARERSPYFAAQSRAIEDVLGPSAGASMAGAFAASPDRFAAAFRSAGLRDVDVREVVADIHLPAIREFVLAHLSAIPWGIAVAEARPDGLELATAAMLDELAPHIEPDGSLTTSLASLLIIGTR